MVGHDPISATLVIPIAAALVAVGTLATTGTIRLLRGTTLIGAHLWVAASLVAIAAVEIWLVWAGDLAVASDAEPLRYFAATLTCCPLMALLGAKRPQDRPWHFIVVSLWIVLALPALHVWLLRAGQTLATPPALAWFILGLIVIGLLNRIMTRAWLSGLLFACGQLLLLMSHLPLLAHFSEVDDVEFAAQMRALFGLGLIGVSAVAAWWSSRPRPTSHDPLDQLWLDFRDLFGVFWALRLAERINSAAQSTKSDQVLRWSGFQTAAGGRISESLSPDAIRILRQGLENLLRRFVSRAWIEQRLKKASDQLTGVEHETL